MESKTARDTRSSALTGFLIALLLAALPVAVGLDLTNLADVARRRQATDLNSVVSSVRSYYASNVVGRVLAHPGANQVIHNYETVPGAIPIPATLSLELGKVISEQQQNISYRFVSDFSFKNRTPHQLDYFEKASLQSLRANPDQKLIDATSSMFSDRVRLVAPVIMAARLQSIAEPGGIVISYETFALVSDVIAAHPLQPITMKGISREVIPYSVDNVPDTVAKGEVMVERIPGLDFYLDPSVVARLLSMPREPIAFARSWAMHWTGSTGGSSNQHNRMDLNADLRV